MMFRVDFVDDYSNLKPLIDYKELSKLIALHEDMLDREKVAEFNRRYGAECASNSLGKISNRESLHNG